MDQSGVESLRVTCDAPYDAPPWVCFISVSLALVLVLWLLTDDINDAVGVIGAPADSVDDDADDMPDDWGRTSDEGPAINVAAKVADGITHRHTSRHTIGDVSAAIGAVCVLVSLSHTVFTVTAAVAPRIGIARSTAC